MYSVHIYIEQNTGTPRRQRRRYGYVITLDGRDYSRTGFGETDGTYHHATLTALTEALERFHANCRITVHANDPWVLDMIGKRLSQWHENGYRTKAGAAVIDADLWEKLYRQTQYQKIEACCGKHSYSTWIVSEMKGMEDRR